MASTGKKSLGSSVDKLVELGFDPIEAMVHQYYLLKKEIEFQFEVSNGTAVRLRADGKPKAYSPDYHMGLIERAALLAEKLLRYGYGRVLEEKDQTPQVAPTLNIHLSDKDGVFTLNPTDVD